jgi:HrpA-like RNA helicase
VGYQIRFESRADADTRLLFCTVGILLRRLQGDPTLKGVTHVLIDEIHERDSLADFVLIIVRDLILSERPDLKVCASPCALCLGFRV